MKKIIKIIKKIIIYFITRIVRIFGWEKINVGGFYEKFILNPSKKAADIRRKEPLERLIKELLDKKEFPLFGCCAIETINRCNGDCDFCPVNHKLDPREFALMSEELFRQIIQQLKELDYSGYLCCYENCEALLDKRIFYFIEYAKKELPKATHFLITNGSLLNLEKFKRLMSNLDYMIIDNYYEGKEKIHNHLLEIAEYCLQSEELMKKVKIQVIDKHAIRNSRAGEAKNRKYIYVPQSSCLIPFGAISINPHGKLFLCCNDALNKQIMGDAAKEKIIDIWRGEYYMNMRKALLESRKNIKICAVCDNFGFLKELNKPLDGYKIGKNWEKIKELCYTA